MFHNSTRSLLGLVVALAAQVAFADAYSPPASSANALKDFNLTGEPVAVTFRKDFADCDRIPHVVRGVAQPQCFGLRREPTKLPDGTTRTRWVKDASLTASDPNQNTTVLKLASGAVLFDGKMAVDNDGSPYAGKWPSQPVTSLHYPDGTSLNADRVPYIAVPTGFDKETGFALGDVAAVIYNNHVQFAIVADHSKPFRIGEGSVALHDALGHAGCVQRSPSGDCAKPASDSIPGGVTYIVFPGTRNQLCKQDSPGSGASRLCEGVSSASLNQSVQSVGQTALDSLKRTAP